RPIAAVGLPNHDRLDWPSPAQEDSTIDAFAALGVRVMITELDVDVLPRGSGPVWARPPRLAATGAGAALCGAVRLVPAAPRDGDAGDLLGRHRPGLLAQQLARARAHELSFAVRSGRPAQAGVRDRKSTRLNSS